MTKRINAKKKISRALGASIWGRNNDPFKKRNFRPGQHGSTAKRETNYAIHLSAKQKVRKHYNMKEGQFRKLFEVAKKSKTNTESVFAGLLESRLASIVYRANLAPTIYSARQLVSHKHISVNGKVINIPSYILNVGDIVKVVDKMKTVPLVAESVQSKEKDIPNYLEFNSDEFSVKLLNRPSVDDVPYPFEANFNLIVEFYSR
ncbi:MAG: 30S ribosomal protein S4 [Rickettsiales bacterium]|jgi:small subunit ribosomal protein S4|nr:30S ribosomal protein S4 [Rickettsiales bacterium]